MPFAPIIIVGSRYSPFQWTDHNSTVTRSLCYHSMDAIYSVWGISWQQQQRRIKNWWGDTVSFLPTSKPRCTLLNWCTFIRKKWSTHHSSSSSSSRAFTCLLDRLNNNNKVTTSLWNLNIFPISIRIRLYFVAVFRNKTKRWPLLTTQVLNTNFFAFLSPMLKHFKPGHA